MIQPPTILFDGVCNFCNSTVNFIIKKDTKAALKFAPLQSSAAQQLLAQYHLPLHNMQSFVFIVNDKAYTQSTAALKIALHLKGLWPLCYAFIIVPKFIRNALYNWIAKNRYKLLGKQQQCIIPTPNISSRFLN